MNSDTGKKLAEVEKISALTALAQNQLTVLHWQQKTKNLVIKARNSGASWSEVGGSLGTSKQAAWEAFHELVPDDCGPATPNDDDGVI